MIIAIEISGKNIAQNINIAEMNRGKKIRLIRITDERNPDDRSLSTAVSFCKRTGNPRSNNIMKMFAAENTVTISPYISTGYLRAIIINIRKKKILSVNVKNIINLLSLSILKFFFISGFIYIAKNLNR